MAVRGAENLTDDQLRFELNRGGRFVVFYFTISILVMTFRRGSPVYFVRAGESAFSKGLPYTLLSLLLGWWGIPFGPIFTVQSLWVNCRGGKDVTSKLVVQVQPAAQAQAAAR